MVLIAQAVPTASQLPCVELKPAGWSVSDVFVRNGRVRFALDSDRVGQGAVAGGAAAVLRHSARSTRVPSDHPGTRRYQEVISIEPGQALPRARSTTCSPAAVSPTGSTSAATSRPGRWARSAWPSAS